MSENTEIFFDHSSTTPVDSRVLDAMLPFLKEEFGNPSSHIHPRGRAAMRAMDDSRATVAKLINADPGEIIFTSGATESNNLAVKGLALQYHKKGKHILISEIEHYSVYYAATRLKNMGFEVEMIPVDQYGVVKQESLKKQLRDDTVLVSIMLTNSEIGTIEPVKELTSVVKKFNEKIIVHTDAASAAGWIPVDVKDLGVDALTLSSHNFYGPKGVGALYLKKGVLLDPLFDGGFQESGRRSGTENVPGVVGMAKAAQLAMEEMDGRNEKLKKLQIKLWSGLEKDVPYIHFSGHPTMRLPGHVSFWVEFVEGESLLLFLTMSGIMAASGSACGSNMRAKDEDELVSSHVLSAVGVPDDICNGSITFFMGKDSTESEVDRTLDVMPGIIQKLLAMSPAYDDMMREKGSK